MLLRQPARIEDTGNVVYSKPLNFAHNLENDLADENLASRPLAGIKIIITSDNCNLTLGPDRARSSITNN